MANTENLEKGLTFSTEEAKQIHKLYSIDSEFRNNFITIRNAWLLQKIGLRNAVQLMKEELEKAVERNNLSKGH